MATARISRLTQTLKLDQNLPGDKSISHRRALLSLLTEESVHLENFASGEDCQTSLNCIADLGKVVTRARNQVTISGKFAATNATLDCGNSGTTVRLLMGLLAGRPGCWTLIGDKSLSRRPMERVAVPLREMGANILLEDGHLPAVIRGRPLHGIDYDSPVVSAQVKSAVLLAGLSATGTTRYREAAKTRDHTERMLGISTNQAGRIVIEPGARVRGDQLSGFVPGDPSSAAFWIVAALMSEDAEVMLRNVLLNPERVALVTLLKSHGANINTDTASMSGGEEVGNLKVTSSTTRPFHVTPSLAPGLIDEIPALSVLASACTGTCEFDGVGELRVKESDRIRLIVDNLRAMGADVEESHDGFAVRGSAKLHGASIRTAGDHRIAMAFAIAGLFADGETVIEHCECASVSYPEFWNVLQLLAPQSVRIE